MKIGTAAHVLLAEARRYVWAVRPEFWDSFHGLLARDVLPLERSAVEAMLDATPQAARTRRGANRRSRSAAVSIIPLQGIITPKASLLSMLFGGGGGLQAFRQNLREALADDDVSAIVLDIDSPGGSTALVQETAAEIRAAREIKPITAVGNTDVGSAAYWLGAQAGELSVTPSGFAGSVGTVICHLSLEGMNEKMGIEPTYVYAGENKVELNPDQALSSEAHAHLQAIVDDNYATFVADVAAGRGVSERKVRETYGGGRFYPASEALARGMVDRVETLEQAVTRLLEEPQGRRPRSRAEVPSDEGGRVSADKAELEEPGGSRRSRKSRRKQDEALADEAIASLSR